MGDGDLVLLGQCGDGDGHAVDVRPLDRRVGALAPAQQGVAPNGDNEAHGSVLRGGDKHEPDSVRRSHARSRTAAGTGGAQTRPVFSGVGPGLEASAAYVGMAGLLVPDAAVVPLRVRSFRDVL